MLWQATIFTAGRALHQGPAFWYKVMINMGVMGTHTPRRREAAKRSQGIPEASLFCNVSDLLILDFSPIVIMGLYFSTFTCWVFMKPAKATTQIPST